MSSDKAPSHGCWDGMTAGYIFGCRRCWQQLAPKGDAGITCGRAAMNEWMLAFLAASTTSSIETSRLLSPYLMFSAKDRSKRTGSWDTMLILERSHGTDNESIPVPSIFYRKWDILLRVKPQGDGWWRWTYQFTSSEVIKPLQKLNAGRFATARGSDQRNILALFYWQVKVSKDRHLATGGIREIGTLEVDVAV